MFAVLSLRRLLFLQWTALLLQEDSYSLSWALKVAGHRVHKVPLTTRSPDAVFALAVSNISSLQPRDNFLATQVWGSARVAAHAIINRQTDSNETKYGCVCELGCGPGLPSLAAAVHFPSVVATDVDPLALQLVQAAAEMQQLTNVQTRLFDILNDHDDDIPRADLYILSDVFESHRVAEAAAGLVDNLLIFADVWVVCQDDRPQRDSFVDTLSNLQATSSTASHELVWGGTTSHHETHTLWLCDVHETNIPYS